MSLIAVSEDPPVASVEGWANAPITLVLPP